MLAMEQNLTYCFFRKQRKIFIIKIFCFEKNLYYGTIVYSGLRNVKQCRARVTSEGCVSGQKKKRNRNRIQFLSGRGDAIRKERSDGIAIVTKSIASQSNAERE